MDMQGLDMEKRLVPVRWLLYIRNRKISPFTIIKWGYRDGSVFQVLFIEYQFGDIYRH